MSNKPPDTNGDPAEDAQAGSLVPLYGTAGIVRGIQAFRRGDIILYTVRGEPKEVLELMNRLDRQGVGEVIALIRHQAPEPPEEDGAAEGDDAAEAGG